MKIDPTLQVAAFTALESAINSALTLDPGTATRLQTLAGKAFKIQCTEPELEIYIIIGDKRIELHSVWELEVTTAISGPAAEYAQLLSATDRGSALVNSGLSLQGDSTPLMKLQEILSEIQLDWEGELAKLLGDVPAHLLGQTVRHITSWGKQTQAIFMHHLEEFLHEEAKLSPSQPEVDHFAQSVEQLNTDTKRLEQGVEKLKQRLKL